MVFSGTQGCPVSGFQSLVKEKGFRCLLAGSVSVGGYETLISRDFVDKDNVGKDEMGPTHFALVVLVGHDQRSRTGIGFAGTSRSS